MVEGAPGSDSPVPRVIPEAARTAAAGQWSVVDIVVAFAIEGLGSPLTALGWLVVATCFMPVTFIWRRYARKQMDADALFIAFHADQMDILCNVLWVGTILSCGCGFPVLLVPAYLVMRAGRRAAMRGECWTLPVFGWIAGKPPV